MELAAKEAPDLAFVDVNLAGDAEDLDLARAFRDRHGTTCIFFTGNAGIAHRAKDVAIGVIEKPYNFDAVVGAVDYAGHARDGKPPPTTPWGLQLFH